MTFSSRWLCYYFVGALCGCATVLGLEEGQEREPETTAGAGGEAGSDVGGAGGGGGETSPCGGLSVLVDDFGDGLVTPGWHQSTAGGGSFDEVNDEAVLWVPADAPSGEAARITWHHHDMRDDFIVLEVTEVPGSDGAAYFEVHSDEVGGEWFGLRANAQNLRFGSNSSSLGEVPYHPIEHRFWRLSFSGGDFHIATSPNVDGPWDTQTSITNGDFDPQYALVAYGLDADNPATGQAARFKSIGGGATQTHCKAETLTDPFDDNTTSEAWSTSGG